MKSLLRSVLFVILVACSLPGLLFIAGRVFEQPFHTYGAQDQWTALQLLNFLLLQFTSPIVIPLLWVGLWFLRPSLPRAAGWLLIAVIGASTLGALGFWILPS